MPKIGWLLLEAIQFKVISISYLGNHRRTFCHGGSYFYFLFRQLLMEAIVGKGRYGLIGMEKGGKKCIIDILPNCYSLLIF